MKIFLEFNYVCAYRIMKLEYLDQYLVHWPVSLKPEANPFALKPDDVLPLDLKSVWTVMEECQKLGLTKSIGVSNFSSKKVADILAFAKIPPAIVQVSSVNIHIIACVT